MIKLQNIKKSYGSEIVLDGLSFEVPKSHCLAILGASGSGKTTCLKLINRLLEPDSGDIFVDGKNIKEYDLIELRENVSYLFQKGVLFPHLTVGENITLPILRRAKEGMQRLGFSSSAKKRAESYLESRLNDLLGLMELNHDVFKKRYPRELSGGQAQRVSLAQALAIHPKVILLDEPFTGLDRKTKYALMEKILEIKDRLHKTLILVTHDHEEADFLADFILELS